MRQIAILGIGVLGYNLAKNLSKQEDIDVIAIDKNPERVDLVSDFVLNAAAADITDEDALRKLGVDQVDLAVVSIGDSIEASILCTAILKKFDIPEIWARAINETQSQVLRLLDITHVINLEEEMGNQVANSIATPNVERFVEITDNLVLADVEPSERYIGETLLEADIRDKYEMNVVAIRRTKEDPETGEEVVVTKEFPRGSETLLKNDVMIVISTREGLERFRKDNG